MNAGLGAGNRIGNRIGKMKFERFSESVSKE
jgi:hypothetical protein